MHGLRLHLWLKSNTMLQTIEFLLAYLVLMLLTPIKLDERNISVCARTINNQIPEFLIENNKQ